MAITERRLREEDFHARGSGAVGAAAALLYGCVFLAANVFPFYDHWHGWPMTYMVRETRMPTQLTIFYGPWPFDNPPVEVFRPVALAFDLATGVALTILGGFLTAAWLRNRRTLQFGMKRLYAVLTVVGVFLAVLGLVAREYGTWILTLLAVRLVYVVPIILILAGAMWVARKLRDSPLRRWAGMHVLTWTALLVVGGPCLYFSLIAYSGPWLAARENAPGWIYLDGVGWPYPYWAAHESDGQRVWAANEGFPTEFFDPAAMAADVLIWLFLLASIAFTVEQWVRRTERESPFEWKRAAIAAVSLVITCLVLDFDDAFLRWSENWFWFLGVACGVYRDCCSSRREAPTFGEG